jgi:hypothetical protein
MIVLPLAELKTRLTVQPGLGLNFGSKPDHFITMWDWVGHIDLVTKAHNL